MRLILTFLVVLIVSQTELPQHQGKRYHAFSGTTIVTLESGADLARTDYSIMKVDYLTKGHIEFFFPTFTRSSFGIRLNVGTGYLSAKDNSQSPALFRTDINFAGAGLLYTLSINDAVFPYVAADASYLWFTPKDEFSNPLPHFTSGIYKKNEINFGGELGFRFLVTDNLSFNINSGIQISSHDFWDDQVKSANNDMFFFTTVGLSFSFFGDRDSDSDGIPDSQDKCDNTPVGIRVDNYGCPVDSDHDGVPDYKDNCPGTPKDVNVDERGCPLDSDKDGVPDYADLCPDTPSRVEVDDLGCPFDHDGDGVPDYMDKCPGTPHNIETDKNGCPVDSDLDGVPDYKDMCANTLFGTRVDTNGCPIIIEEKKPEIKKDTTPQLKELSLSADKCFNRTGELTMSGKIELDKLLAYMKSDPLSRWVIEGYTDAAGKTKPKDDIKRASGWTSKIMNYFVLMNIPKNRIQVANFGRSYPVSENKTDIGRSKNRRIVIKKVN